MPTDRILRLGAEDYEGGDSGVFNMAVMGFRLAQRANGVSLAPRRGQPRHVQRPVAGLRRGRGADHLDHQRRARPDLGRPRGLRAGEQARRRHRLRRPRRCGTSSTRSRPTDLWSTKRELRPGSSRTSGSGCASPGASVALPPAELGWIDSALDPDVLTIGFARRVPSYKRLTLMLRDPERLKRLLLDPERPVQLVIAGKAHPADDGGKQLIQEIVPLRRRPGGAAPDRVPAELRHRHGAAALPGLRRVAEQPAASLRGVRHLRHEGRAQRRPEPVDPRRLVGRVVRRQQRLGDPVGRRRRGHRPA